MVLSRLFGGGAKQGPQPSPAAGPPPPILVRRSVFEDADDASIVSALVDDYVNPLMGRGCYLRSEMPPNAMRSYHTDYYLAQVANGGHGQFMHNSGMEPLVLKDIREGLAAIGIEPFVTIFKEFEAFAATGGERAAAAAEAAGFGPKDSAVAALDERFFAARCYETLMPANGRWLKSLPELSVVADAEFPAAIESLIAANPQAGARKAARERERLAGLLQDPLHVPARLLAYEAGILPVKIGGGDPAAKTPDGRSAIGWAVNAQQGSYRMFVLEDAAILCEQYLADGRKLTRELMNEIHAALFSGKADLDVLKGFEQQLAKEIARVPAALIQEAMAVAREARVLAAAELACARLRDELVDLHALGKTADRVWRFALWAKGGQYLMRVGKDGMVVAKLGPGPAGPIETERLLLPAEEVRRYEAAAKGGRA